MVVNSNCRNRLTILSTEVTHKTDSSLALLNHTAAMQIEYLGASKV